jgi:hypothetical protein
MAVTERPRLDAASKPYQHPAPRSCCAATKWLDPTGPAAVASTGTTIHEPRFARQDTRARAGARGRIRTGMALAGRRILSPLRLPVSPPGRDADLSRMPRIGRNTRRRPEAPSESWRPGSESNRRTRLCRPLHDHSATRPWMAIAGLSCPENDKTPGSPRSCMEAVASESGAGNETRTRDPDLGKVVLYQLSYSRRERASYGCGPHCQPLVTRVGAQRWSRSSGHAARR